MSNVIVIAQRSRHSPCVGICKLDDATGYCLGCARTGDEIGRWSGMTDAQRDAVWTELPPRHEALRINMRLLPWMADEIGDWAARTIGAGLGTWVTGAPGAIAEFPCVPGAPVAVERTTDALVARAADGAFRLELHDKLRAFAFGAYGPIVLGWPKARGGIGSAAAFTPLEDDSAAIDAAYRGHRLFDMGTGRKASRFCIRTSDAKLNAMLDPLAGRSWGDVMREAGMAIFAAQPHRVVESRLARIEVFSPISLPGSASPPGACTHFLPEILKLGEESPASLALPDYASPVAIFYPGRG